MTPIPTSADRALSWAQQRVPGVPHALDALDRLAEVQRRAERLRPLREQFGDRVQAARPAGVPDAERMLDVARQRQHRRGAARVHG